MQCAGHKKSFAASDKLVPRRPKITVLNYLSGRLLKTHAAIVDLDIGHFKNLAAALARNLHEAKASPYGNVLNLLLAQSSLPRDFINKGHELDAVIFADINKEPGAIRAHRKPWVAI